MEDGAAFAGLEEMPQPVIDALLDRACPSICYRLRREVLGQSPAEPEMVALQARIMADPAVQEVTGWQAADGWLGWNFHGTGGIEHGLRLLCEKGVESSQPVLAAALDALEAYPDRLQRGIGKVGPALDAAGLGGAFLIRAALLAQAGGEDRADVPAQIAGALASFGAVRGVRALTDVSVPYKGKRVFQPGVRWPSLYDLRLLAYSHAWRTPENLALLAEAVARLIALAPIPDIYLRHKAQLMAPASVFMHDLAPELAALDAAGWMGWFHRTELLARLGVVRAVPALQRQVETLRALLTADGGWFTRRLSHAYFRQWGAYSGLMLEPDWKAAGRRINDLTFRSLLILHYASHCPPL